MLIISMLSQQGDGVLSVIRVQLRHVQIVYVVNQLHLTSRSVLSSGLFLKLLLQHGLEVG